MIGKAIIPDVGSPEEATQVFDDMRMLNYDRVLEENAPIIGSGDPEAEMALARRLGAVIREEYLIAARLADG